MLNRHVLSQHDFSSYKNPVLDDLCFTAFSDQTRAKKHIQTRRQQMAIIEKRLTANSGSSTPLRRILKNRNIKARIERLKKETKEIRKEQKDIAEGHREIAKKLHLIKTSHAQMKKDIQVLNQGSRRLQCRLNITFKILKARKLGDSIEEKKLVQLLLSIAPPN